MIAATLVAAACGNRTPAQGAGAPPPTAVKTMPLSTTSIEDASEFIATVRSLRSTTIQPEVEGIITRIFVKSGDKVSVGTPLLQIDPARQQAAVSRSGQRFDAQALKVGATTCAEGASLGASFGG